MSTDPHGVRFQKGLLDMRKNLLLLLMVTLALGCSPSFKVIETTDRFEPNSRRLTSSPIKIDSPRHAEGEISLSFGYFQSASLPDGAFTMTISHYSDLWALPDEVKIRVDDRVESLRPSQPSKQNVDIGRVSEHLTVEVPELLLRSMLAASILELRLVAQDRQIDRMIEPEAQDLMREFYTEVRGRR